MTVLGGKITIFKELEINRQIRDYNVFLIDETGQKLGVMPATDANRIADERNFDLVKIAARPNEPPVCKLMDYAKFRFDAIKKDKEDKRSQRQSELKEMWLSMTIGAHDLDTKATQTRKFLVEGDKVKVSIRMKGRQQAHANMGIDVMNRFFALLSDVSVKDGEIQIVTRNIIMLLVPNKK
ncbi:MAG: translation initiation factor IF-3 [Clostridiales bacterium]|nr:translation initiation factor IF-3 [Clostridiales bacterium]